MMSASEGGGGSWKSGRSRGGCVNSILQISSKCGQGGRGSKNLNILQMSFMEAPLLRASQRDTETVPRADLLQSGCKILWPS